jgi:AGZA family xanthine/uracil permease-like MFS transporter
VTLVRLADLDGKTLLSLLGLLLTAVLVRRRNPLAFLLGIVFVTGSASFLGWVPAPAHWIEMPDFQSVFLKLDIWGALRFAFLPAILAVFFTDLFDSLSTFVGVSHAAGLVDRRGEPVRLKEGLIVDAVATLGAGLVGTSSGTAYVESAAGIEAGGRTGLTSVFTALCFLPCFFFAPVAGAIPIYATAPALILVGAGMFRSINDLRLEKMEDLLPAFLTLILIPLTFSITQGILWGIVTHTLMYVLVGRRREISPTLGLLCLLCLVLLVVENGHWVGH